MKISATEANLPFSFFLARSTSLPFPTGFPWLNLPRYVAPPGTVSFPRLTNSFCKQQQCKNSIVTTPPDQLAVENEFYFLMHCNQYDHLRSVLFSKLSCPQFDQMNDQNKFCYILTCPLVGRIVDQFIIDAFDSWPVF